MDGIYWTGAKKRRIEAWYARRISRCPAELQQRRFDTSLGSTFALVCGPAEAPPVLLLHGGLTNSSMWFRSLPEWSTHFRVHAVDVIGDPGFSAPTRPDFSSDAHATWLGECCTRLGLRHPHIVGASLGGWLALDFAIRHPDRAASLVLISPVGIVPMRRRAVLRQVSLAMLGARGRRVARMLAFGLTEDQLKPGDRDFLDFVGMVQTDVMPRARLPEVLRDDDLQRLRCPVMVMLGAKDVFFDAEACRRRFESLVPGARVDWYPDWGHAVVDPTTAVRDHLFALTGATGQTYTPAGR
jgi:pimeloyl-ACP methyl ester carboxylesterase